MAPLFLKAVQRKGYLGNFPAKMFQKPLAAMAVSHRHLKRDGDFYLQPNLRLSEEIFSGAADQVYVQDVVNMCIQWYRKPPAKIPNTCHVASSRGGTEKLSLSSLVLEGAW